MAEGFAAAGIDLIYMGRGSSIYKDAMKSRDVYVAEGVATSRSVLGVAHRTRISSSRRVTGAVNAHPGLLKGARRIRRLVRPDAPPDVTAARSHRGVAESRDGVTMPSRQSKWE